MSTHNDAAARKPKYSDGTSRKKRPRDPHPAALSYDVDETGRVLGISRRSVYALLAEQKLLSVKLCGRRVITRASCEQLLEAELKKAALE